MKITTWSLFCGTEIVDTDPVWRCWYTVERRSVPHVCPRCAGDGDINCDECKLCSGTGIVWEVVK